jgi:ABC-type multidrug transport system ATPase subunit
MGLIGPNGAGKTTFLGCLPGLLTPSAGRCSWAGGRPITSACGGRPGTCRSGYSSIRG